MPDGTNATGRSGCNGWRELAARVLGLLPVLSSGTSLATSPMGNLACSF
jgi:hypothetical protein